VRILYVEDNPANLYLVKRVAHNHEVINYVDGEDALANFDDDRPDLVLMDVQLAGHLSGLDVVRKLRASGHKVPIVALTAYAMVGDRDQCMAAGCDDYIAKPLPIPQFVRMIEHYNELTLKKAQTGGETIQPTSTDNEASNPPAAVGTDSTGTSTEKQSAESAPAEHPAKDEAENNPRLDSNGTGNGALAESGG
jgi:two-component system, cell cycle response regulator DivK